MSEKTAMRVTVHGRVQGVFYRDWTVRSARELGITGWVCNEPDGTVAAHLEGSPEALQAMVERMHQGPSAARVERIELAVCASERFECFERR